MVNGREQKNLRKISGKKTTLGWFKLRISRLCFGCGGEWLWKEGFQENQSNNLFWFGPTLESQSFVFRCGGEWWLKEFCRKSMEKTTLGWFNLRITRLCFGYGGEWWWEGKPQENHWQENYLWVGPIQEPQGFVIDMVVEENISGKSLEKLLWGGSL